MIDPLASEYPVLEYEPDVVVGWFTDDKVHLTVTTRSYRGGLRMVFENPDEADAVLHACLKAIHEGNANGTN